MNSFKKYSKYYNYLYSDKDYKSETAYIVNLVNKFKSDSKNIIDLGCGTGKHAILLSKNGYEVIGLDQSEDMISIAKLSSPNQFIIDDITTFKLKQQFDVALSIFHVFSYITDNEHLQQAFLNVNGHLKKDGIFIFDVWHTPAVHSQIPETRTKIFENEEFKILRTAQPIVDGINNIVDVVYNLKINNKMASTEEVISETHHIRHFSKTEIELLCNNTGFQIIDSEELITSNKPSKSTWGVCYILKKISLLSFPLGYIFDLSLSYF